MKILQTIILIPGLICLVLLGGCGGEIDFSRILLADMDQFNNNTNLSVSLPGPPTGDRAENVDNVSVESIENINGQSLRMAGQIDLIPISHNDPTEYTISWDGFRTQVGNTANTTISFMDQSGNIAFRIVFDGTSGRYSVEAEEPVPPQNYDAVGHEVSITMNPVINQFSFKFEQNNCNGIDDCADMNGLDFVDSDFDELSRVRITGGEYYFDDFSVIVRPPL